MVGIVQRSERRPVTPNVVGSNPTVHPKFERESSDGMTSAGVDGKRYFDSGDGTSPRVQRRVGMIAPSGFDRSDMHNEVPSFSENACVAQLDLERLPPKEKVAGSSPAMSTTLATTAGSPLDYDCPLCGAPKGEKCRSASTHYDRVRLIRLCMSSSAD